MWMADFISGASRLCARRSASASGRKSQRAPRSNLKSSMPINIDPKLTPQKLLPKIQRLFELSAHKIVGLQKTWQPGHGAPVFTVKGRYTARDWTEWTQGFQFGSALLQFDATADKRFLEMGRRST